MKLNVGPKNENLEKLKVEVMDSFENSDKNTFIVSVNSILY